MKEPAKDDSQKPMYCKDKIYCGAEEYSFEELRALRWQKKRERRQREEEEQKALEGWCEFYKFWKTLPVSDKLPKNSDTRKICSNHPKIRTRWLYCRVMLPNDADGMANGVDPDQTAPLGAG